MKIAFIADIHSNLEAFNAVLSDIKSKGIKKIFCVGDIVGYATDCNEVTELIKKEKIKSSAGNHDYGIILKKLPEFNQYAQKALVWTSKQLKKENKDFLLKLPKILDVKIGSTRITLIHGSPNNPLYTYVFPNTLNETFKKFLIQTKSDILVLGHTHIPMIKRFGRKLVLNPGSVGQPRDSIPKASYCTLDLENLAVNINRVTYNISKTANKIIANGLPRYSAERLYLGR